jgi:conjugative transfer signal peptidase TraF
MITRRDAVMVFCLSLIGVTLVSLFMGFVRINATPSAEVGFYRRHAVTHLTSGMLVSVPVPIAWQATAIRLGIVPNDHTSLLKPIAALPGDEVCITVQTLWVRGVDYGPIVEGFSPAFEGCVTIEPGEVFLASDVPRSFDSRYFDSIPIDRLTGRLTPLWTW